MNFHGKLVKQVKTTLLHSITLGGRFLLNWPIKKDKSCCILQNSLCFLRWLVPSGVSHAVPKRKSLKRAKK